jgi:hypothetical protein
MTTDIFSMNPVLKKRLYLVSGILFTVGLTIYGYLSYRYYKSINPELEFKDELQPYALIKESDLRFSEDMLDPEEKLAGKKIALTKPEVYFGPTIQLPVGTDDPILSADRMLVKTTVKGDDLSGVEMVMQMDDRSGQTYVLDFQPLKNEKKKWSTQAILYRVDLEKLKNAGLLKFYTVNKNQKKYQTRSITAYIYKRK